MERRVSEKQRDVQERRFNFLCVVVFVVSLILLMMSVCQALDDSVEETTKYTKMEESTLF